MRFGCIALGLVALASTSSAAPLPPSAPRRPQIRILHGEKVQDDYAWLRDRRKARAYLAAEAAYAERMTAPMRGLRDRIRDEIVARTREDDVSPPYRRAGYVYSTRLRKGDEHSSYWRHPIDERGTATGPDSVILDLNALARPHRFFQLGDLEPSDDGHFLAYTADTDGREDFRLYVKDLRTGRLRPEHIPRVGSIAWAADGRTLLYVLEDKAQRPYRVLRHRLDGRGADQVVYEEKDERFRVGLYRTTDRALLVITSESHTTSEARYLSADRPEAEPTLVAAREPDHEYQIDHGPGPGAGMLYIRTNRSARNFRIMTAPLETHGTAAWRELVPHREDVMIEDLQVFADYVVLSERDRGSPELEVLDLPSGARHRVGFDQAVRDVSLSGNYTFDSPTFRFVYHSPISPPSYFDYAPRTRERRLVKREDVPGGFDPERYEVRRVEAHAADGTTIPISLLSSRDARRDGSAPLLLEGYGAYGLVADTGFDESLFSLVDRGFSIAWAHVRGGGELGRRWHDGGRMLNKRNTFTDFIAAAEWLVENRYTSPSRLVIRGDSAGGLLVGAVVNLRPELFRVAIAEVPFVDVVNTMLDESLPLTVGEFEEWGNPKDPEHYTYLRSYCPYENVVRRAYPSMLVTSALNDARAPYWEAAKWVAKLRTCKADDNPLLFRIDLSPAGHGGRSGRYEQIEETAYEYAFILSQLGY